MKACKFTISIFLLAISQISYAKNWNCTNNDMEIHCDSKGCEVSDAFTPLSVSLETDGEMSICVYSGCFEGKGEVINNKTHIFYSGYNLKFSTSNSEDMKADFLIAIDDYDKIAVIKGFGYAMPKQRRKISI